MAAKKKAIRSSRTPSRRSTPTRAAIRPKRAEAMQLMDICMPHYTNSRGVMFGGKVLELMDKAAAIAAHRYCGGNAVTASTERVDFLTPIKEGYIVDYRGKVVFTGRTSMTIQVTVHSESTAGGIRRLCCVGFVNMVAIGPRGRPIPVPPLLVETAEEKVDYELGRSLRKARLQYET